jgi:hypothetical protein
MHISIEKSGKDSASNIGLTSAVNSIFQPSVFRSSVELKNALKAIVERYVVPQLKYCWGQQSFNIRLDTSYFFNNFLYFLLTLNKICATDNNHYIDIINLFK